MNKKTDEIDETDIIEGCERILKDRVFNHIFKKVCRKMEIEVFDRNISSEQRNNICSQRHGIDNFIRAFEFYYKKKKK
jgi:hypothetical protein